MAQPLVDWLLLVLPMKGGCAFDGAILGQLPGRTRRAVAIDPEEVEDWSRIADTRRLQKHKKRGIAAHMPPKVQVRMLYRV